MLLRRVWDALSPGVMKEIKLLKVLCTLPVGGIGLLTMIVGLCVARGSMLKAQEKSSSQQSGEHLFIEPKDLKSETCLNCHAEKKDGRSVHSVLGSGCESCHQWKSENGKTEITLMATGGELCAMCHEAKKASVLHGPYKDGQCILCHDPHASNFKAHTRADGNALCLECHLPRRIMGETVTLFTNQTMAAKDFEAIPKIELDPMHRLGHPFALHPVAQIQDPLHPEEKMSCLSCHDYHGSNLQSMILEIKPAKDAKGAKDICDACHIAFEEQKKNKLQKLNQAQIEAQEKARQDLLDKKQSGSQMAAPKSMPSEKQQ